MNLKYRHLIKVFMSYSSFEIRVNESLKLLPMVQFLIAILFFTLFI